MSFKSANQLFRKLIVDEQGGEVVEYVLIVGLITVLVIVSASSIGTKLLDRWKTIANSF
jgi:Flp pilus assembly pilin Flp